MTDLPAVTDIARTLRQSAERMTSGDDLDADALANQVDDMIGQARRHGTMARLVGPWAEYPLIEEIEDVLAPLYRAIKSVRRVHDVTVLVNPARKLMKLRDELIHHVRAGEDAL